MTEDGTATETVLDRVDRPVFALDDDWRFTYLNGGAERLLNVVREELLGRVIWDALPGVMETDLPAAFHGAITEGETRRTTVPVNGDRRVEFETHPGEGGVTVLLRDVTDERERDHRLRRYETAFNAADDPIYVLDTRGEFREVNDAMVEMTGYDRDRLVGSHISLVMSQEEIDRAERRIRETVVEDDQSVGTIEATFTTAAGARRDCEVSVALLPEDGGIAGTVGVVRDVTDRRQREQRLAVLDRVLRHNIRNEMNLVIGQAEVAKGMADDDVAEHLDAILSTSRELVDLSRDIRRFSDALDPGLGEARPRDATDSVTAIVDDVERDQDAEILVTVEEEARFYAHESVFAAIEELLRNAVLHNDSEDPTVECTVGVEGDRVAVEVADDGPGLPDPEREVLVEGDETPLTHASGLGLWLVNWAVTKSGGHLTFAENEPQGSVVTIHLPRAPPADAVEEAEDASVAAGDGGAPEASTDVTE